MTILAIDPGNTHSGVAVIDPDDRRPITVAKAENESLFYDLLRMPKGALGRPGLVVVEMVASYGMPVGREVFEACVWIGRFQAAAETSPLAVPVRLVYRRDVKLHHCMSPVAKDSNVTQALIDRFAPGQPNRGKGTKREPGWFHGFAADIWQAYALAVYAADTLPTNQPPLRLLG